MKSPTFRTQIPVGPIPWRSGREILAFATMYETHVASLVNHDDRVEADVFAHGHQPGAQAMPAGGFRLAGDTLQFNAGDDVLGFALPTVVQQMEALGDHLPGVQIFRLLLLIALPDDEGGDAGQGQDHRRQQQNDHSPS